MRGKSLAEPLLLEICLKGREEPLIQRALHVGGGRRGAQGEQSASMLCSSGDVESFTLALECNGPLKEGKRLLIFSTQCMFLLIVY